MIIDAQFYKFLEHSYAQHHRNYPYKNVQRIGRWENRNFEGHEELNTRPLGTALAVLRKTSGRNGAHLSKIFHPEREVSDDADIFLRI
jgi:hypothetical protein